MGASCLANLQSREGFIQYQQRLARQLPGAVLAHGERIVDGEYDLPHRVSHKRSAKHQAKKGILCAVGFSSARVCMIVLSIT